MARPDSWFRMYNTTLDNPKVQRLPGELFKAWVNLLCLASKTGGELPCAADIAFALRKDETEIETLLETLHARGLLDLNGVSYTPHDWADLQFKSDKSTARVQEYRERKKKQSVSDSDETEGNVSRNVSETAQEKSRTDQRREEVGGGSADADATHKPRSAEEDEAVDVYNDLAGKLSWPKCEKLSASRRAKLRARLRDCAGLDGWRAALARAQASRFLRGETGRSNGHENWRPDIDFFLTESKFLKLREGGYDSAQAPAATPTPRARTADEWRAALRRFKDSEVWPPVGYGPQPGYGGCIVPPDILAEFGLLAAA